MGNEHVSYSVFIHTDRKSCNKINYRFHVKFARHYTKFQISGFGGLEVACWPLVPKFAGSHPAKVIGFLGWKKIPQHAFLQRGSKAVGPMS
jgi:hypothetical protein